MARARVLLRSSDMRFVDRDDFAAHVAAHLGATTLDLDRACELVIGAFAGWLPSADRTLFMRELPSSLGAAVEHATLSVALPLEEQVVGAFDVTVGHARELVASVCHVLGEHLSDDLLDRLQRALPAPFAAFTVRPLPGSTVATSRAARRYETLAEGRPGSHTPVSEARVDRRQQQASVAADNPHGDAKLSSAPGTT